MKQVIQKISFTLLMSAVLVPASLLAQSAKEKAEKDEKDKSAEQIIITRKGDKADKIVIEVNGDKVTVNGKDVKDSDGEVTVRRNKIKDVRAYGGNRYTYNYNTDFNSMAFDTDRAMLGVTTEKVDKGVEVQEVTKGSAAEKAGLKKGDIITKIDDKKIDSPDDLSAAIKKHKAGEKVTVGFLRDKKEMKETAELTKWKGVSVFSTTPGQFDIDLGDLNMNLGKIRMPSFNGNFGQNWNWSGTGGPKLGMSVQDAEDGRGVKVLDVDEDGNAAKGGIKEGDVLTEVDGKAVNSADEVAKIVRDSRDKGSINIKLTRGGKAESVTLTIPRRLKTTDL
ncbi:MAG: PDZ domain-containing protein [Sphingobacteriales bacterium]|nr:PDZ domain-containing protein [Sphingobacteriales bacterium]OJW02986.1 MAG: hypothetical protein BGO52_01370 [Sphingobacteriales bacterium 44-61]